MEKRIVNMPSVVRIVNMPSVVRIVNMPSVVRKERSVQLNLSDESYIYDAQIAAILDGSGELFDIIKKQIHIKLQGYRSQDLTKGIYNEAEFMDMSTTMRLLVESDLTCFYCKCHVKVLYKMVREGCQWTLERIDNGQGHNKNNVVVACLDCNLGRRTMYHERFAFTKQLVIQKNV